MPADQTAATAPPVSRSGDAVSAAAPGPDRRTGARIRAIVADHPSLIGWLLAVAGWSAWLAYTWRIRKIELIGGGDEVLYWIVSGTIEDPLRLSGYTQPLRGVSFPLIIRWLSTGFGLGEPGPRGVTAMLAVICVPLLTAVIAPSLVRSLGVRTRVGVVRILALNLLFFVFWRNDTLRLLSDIPALTAFAGALALLARTARPGRRGRIRLALLGLAAGALVAVAANTRPAYLLAGAVVVVGIPVLRWGASRLGTAFVLAAAVIGVLVGFAPQITVNRYQDAGWSLVPSKSGELAQLQLRLGLDYQRYDTYVGPPEEYPTAPMIYDNSANLGTLDVESVTSAPTFVWAALRAPVPAIETMGRHAFNGLDIRWPGTYVEDIHEPMVVTQVANFSILVLAAGILGTRGLRWARSRGSRDGTWVERGTPVRLWFAVVLGTFTAQALATAMETRFLLPLHLVLLAVVALTARPDDVPRTVPGRVGALVGGAALVVAAVAFSSSVFGTLTPPVPELGATTVAPTGAVAGTATPHG